MSSQRETVLAMLEEAGEGGVTSNRFFESYLPRFSARIHELRKAGYRIDKEPAKQGHWRYKLIGGESTEPSASRAGGLISGQLPDNTPPATELIQVAPEPVESSQCAEAISPPPQEPRMGANTPRQITDTGGGTQGTLPSDPLPLFDMPVNRYADVA